jgi:very-long-chain ceramide synthase
VSNQDLFIVRSAADFLAGIALTVLAMLMAVHNLYPSLRAYTTPFFQISYYQPSTGLYHQGYDDIYFILCSVIGLTAVRAITIDWIFRPIAKLVGLKKKACVRFAEQAWLLGYDGSVWAMGMVSRGMF